MIISLEQYGFFQLNQVGKQSGAALYAFTEKEMVLVHLLTLKKVQVQLK